MTTTAAPTRRISEAELRIQTRLNSEDFGRARDAHNNYPMPSSYFIGMIVAGFLPAVLVVLLPGVLTSTTTVTLLLGIAAVYTTRRVFGIRGPESPLSNAWDATTWKLPTATDLLIVLSLTLPLLALGGASYIEAALALTGVTWAGLVARMMCSVRHRGKTGRALLRDIKQQWAFRDAQYRKFSHA